MEIDQLIKVLAPILTLLIGIFIKHYTEKKSKLIGYYGHVSSFNLRDNENTTLNAHSVIIRNAGKKSAFNVRAGHGLLPEGFSVFPSVNFIIEQNPNGASEIIFPCIVQNEQITISYFYKHPITISDINLYVKSDDGYIDHIQVIPSPPMSQLLYWIKNILMFSGASFLIYLIFFAINSST